MRPGLAQLEVWDPAALGAGAARAADLRAGLDRAASDTEQSAAWTRRGWDGPGADAAFVGIGSAQCDTTRIASLIGELEAALLTAEAAVGDARDVALEAAARARAEGFEVADDGEVTPSPAQVADAEEDRDLAHRARTHTAAIRSALDAVDAADLDAKATIDAACAQMYAAPSPAASVISLGTGAGSDPGSSGPGWAFDPGVDPRTMAASTIIGGMTEATRIGAATALDTADDLALRRIFGGMDHLVSGPFAKEVMKGVSRAGAVGAVASAVPSIHENIEGGMDAPTAIGSEVAGAGAGLFAGAASAALVGAAVGGPVGLVGGFVAGAVVGGGASWLATKTVQFASRKVQDG